MQTRFIVVTGGVISGVGKGVATASIGKILKEYGYTVTLIKIDPYINYDAGTLRPTEHGEVWVTDDGGEIDQDLGTYERFLDENLLKKNNITTGQIYKTIIERERAGGYLGQTVQYVPHVINEVKDRILEVSRNYEIVVIELGGTVGDYENTPYLCAFKSLERDLGSASFAYVLVTYLPVPHHIGEMKTKPTQQAIRLLGQEGILPDFIICRSAKPLDDERRKKIETFAHLDSNNIIAAPDLSTVYRMPLYLEEQKLGKKILTHLGLSPRKQPEWIAWQNLVHAIERSEKKINIGIVGKYLHSGDYCIADSYVSIYQALIHAGAQAQIGIEVIWLDSQQLEESGEYQKQCAMLDGIIIPGGFGATGVQGKIEVIRYAREYRVPLLGLCYGMQLMVVEWARNKCGLENAHTTEIDSHTAYPVIDVLPMQKEYLQNSEYGGTMRLGSYNAELKKGTVIYNLYQQKSISERHRHRYEVNPLYIDTLEEAGIVFSGYHVRNDGTRLMEFVELPKDQHPFFVATQAHPEFKSRLEKPSPLFKGFIDACYTYKKPQENIVNHVAEENMHSISF